MLFNQPGWLEMVITHFQETRVIYPLVELVCSSESAVSSEQTRKARKHFSTCKESLCSFNVTFKNSVAQYFIVVYSFHITLVGLQTLERPNKQRGIFIHNLQMKKLRTKYQET